MKILVTGGAGFIGSNLTEFLLNLGHEVKVLDNLSTGRIENLHSAMVNPKFEFIQDSVTRREIVHELMEWCDHCYHLAAPVGVKYIMENPIRTILDNIRGADLVLEAVNTYKKRVMMASTSEIYGKSLDLLDNTHSRKLKETDYRVEGSTRNHRWAYANTKAMDEFLGFCLSQRVGTEIVIARFFNTVGPRQLFNYGMVIPNFVKRALNNEDVVVFGTGGQKRSFMHVNDAIQRHHTADAHRKRCREKSSMWAIPFEITMNELAEKRGSQDQ